MKRIAYWLYQFYVFLVLTPVGFLLTLIAGWLTVLVAVLSSPRIASRYVAANWARLIAFLTPVWVTVEGAENADPSRSYVVVCNHQSQYDIFLVYGWLKLDLKWVLKAELRKVPGVGIGCEKAGHIYVDRSNPEQARKAVQDALDNVGDGVGILFFAEGTRSPDGKLRPFKKGAFRVATSQGLPILPVTIIGTRDIQKPRSLFIFPGKIRMVVHPAIDVDRDDAGSINRLMEQTRQAIASALPEELR
ncbi:MAG: 1-acyl-sn-glycerol-3-phosphate acyltransferase [Gammaproteobacteria bacterium]|nr:1-acyl-sn-glycerol-3-phosphate acyltransferase [Gammaproteobacteria bacterium]MBT8075636.1 1-acyl-sn-glycerol-3-phosphate acyltransferase [Gammaproteobacteria bacterium]NNK97533.1 1-acyl-sn-glycerol-3-phosphate acyltransferase [Xanthomonadales bacterium]